VEGSVIGYEFTATDDQIWRPNGLSGMQCLIEQNGADVTPTPIKIVTNTNDSITMSTSSSLGTLEEDPEECTLYFYPSNQLYLINNDANGYEFNGISDEYEEVPAVTNLRYYNINDDIWDPSDDVGGETQDWNDLKYIDLQWDNMWNHQAITGHQHADGVTRDISQNQFKKNQSYVVFMQIKDFTFSGEQDIHPVFGNDEWFEVYSIGDQQLTVEEKPTYTVRIGALPVNKQIGFWVGCTAERTPEVSSVKDIPSVRGEITFKEAAPAGPPPALLIGHFVADDLTLGETSETWVNRVEGSTFDYVHRGDYAPASIRTVEVGPGLLSGHQVIDIDYTSPEGYPEVSTSAITTEVSDGFTMIFVGLRNDTFRTDTTLFRMGADLEVSADIEAYITSSDGQVGGFGVRSTEIPSSAQPSSATQDYKEDSGNSEPQIIIITVDGITEDVKIYFRGQLINTIANKWTPKVLGEVYLLGGTIAHGGYQSGYSGFFAEHRMYDKVLTEAERISITNELAATYNIEILTPEMVGQFVADDLTITYPNKEVWVNRIGEASGIVEFELIQGSNSPPSYNRRVEAGVGDLAGHNVIAPISGSVSAYPEYVKVKDGRTGPPYLGSGPILAGQTFVFIGQSVNRASTEFLIQQFYSSYIQHYQKLRGSSKTDFSLWTKPGVEAYEGTVTDWDSEVTDGSSYIITIVYDGLSKEVKTYFRGELVLTLAEKWLPKQFKSSFYLLGQSNNNAAGFNGHMAEMRIYNHALNDTERIATEAELATEYNVVLR